MLKFIKGEKALLLSVITIIIVKLLAGNPYIGAVGHFGPLTGVVLVFTFLVIIYTATGVARHAERLAEKFGEPYGTIILTLSAVLVEVIMVMTMMLHGDQDPTVARDTIFSTLMILLNGLIGFTLLFGGLKYGEQRYNIKSSKAFLSMIFILVGLGLLLPDLIEPQSYGLFTIFLIVNSIALYLFFLFMQSGRQSYFFTYQQNTVPSMEKARNKIHSNSSINGLYHAMMLFFTLAAISILAEFFTVAIDDSIHLFKAPEALAGLITAIVILTPEGLTAVRAGLRNDMQRVINIVLGSSLSTVALTIPAVLLIGHIMHKEVLLGLPPVQAGILIISLLIASITESTGETNSLEGLIQLMLFCAFVFTMFI
jgi:Ca2+:H+ antiporter